MKEYPMANLQSGSVFKTSDGSIYMKLMDPEKVSVRPVWATDIGNGHIKIFDDYDSSKTVVLLGRCLDMIVFNYKKGIQKASEPDGKSCPLYTDYKKSCEALKKHNAEINR